MTQHKEFMAISVEDLQSEIKEKYLGAINICRRQHRYFTMYLKDLYVRLHEFSELELCSADISQEDVETMNLWLREVKRILNYECSVYSNSHSTSVKFVRDYHSHQHYYRYPTPYFQDGDKVSHCDKQYIVVDARPTRKIKELPCREECRYLVFEHNKGLDEDSQYYWFFENELTLVAPKEQVMIEQEPKFQVGDVIRCNKLRDNHMVGKHRKITVSKVIQTSFPVCQNQYTCTIETSDRNFDNILKREIVLLDDYDLQLVSKSTETSAYLKML